MERATGKKGVMKRMNEQEKKEITEMTEPWKIWSTGREESQKEESHTGGSGAGQPVDQGEESQTQTPDVFQSK